MIQIVKQNNEIIQYLQRDRCVNLNVLSYLAYNKDADVYIYGDNIENGIITSSASWRFHFLATYNRDFLKAFWEFLPAGHKMFSGVAKPIADIMIEGKEPVWQSPCKVFIYKGGAQIVENTSDYLIEPLTVNDAEEVDKYYTYRSEGSVKRLRESIEKMDSACIRLGLDDCLASWCLVHAEDGSLGPLYTKEEFRGKGMGEALAVHLIKKLVTKNMTPYAQIADDNAPSLALIKKLEDKGIGMGFSHDCVWFGLDKS